MVAILSLTQCINALFVDSLSKLLNGNPVASDLRHFITHITVPVMKDYTQYLKGIDGMKVHSDIPRSCVG